MTHNDDFIAQLEDYFEAFDGATPLPDRVRDAIRAELPSARQVRPRTGLLRFSTMLSNVPAGARLGVAAAAVVLAAVLGAAVLNTNGSRVGGPGAAPTPSPSSLSAPSTGSSATSLPSPSVTESGSAEPLTLTAAPIAACDSTDVGPTTCVAAGTYQLNNWPGPNTWPVRITIQLPAGWFDWDAAAGMDAALVDGGPEARGGSGWGVLFATVGDVSRDPCDLAKGVIPAAQVNTPQKLAAAMAAWPKFTATSPQPVKVDGRNGLKLQLSSTAPSACNASGTLWRTTSGGAMNVYPMIASGARDPGTFEIVDTGNGLLVIRTTDFAQTTPTELEAGVAANPTRHSGDLAELHAILDSIRFTTLPG